jgi:hypothetical protein
MRQEVKEYTASAARILGLERVKVEIRDLWAMECPVWGFADRQSNTICLHEKQNDWKDTVNHELAHLATPILGHHKVWWIYYNKLRRLSHGNVC